MQVTGAFQRYRAVAVGGEGTAVNARLAASASKLETASRDEWLSRRGGDVGDKDAPSAGNAKGKGGDSSDSGEGLLDFEKDGKGIDGGEGGRSGGGIEDEKNPAVEEVVYETQGREEKTKKVAGEKSSYDRRKRWRDGEQERRPLAPEHRTVLKHALSALWESVVGDDGRVTFAAQPPPATASARAGGKERDETERGVGEMSGPKLKAAELSATVYCVSPVLPSYRGGGKMDNGGDADRLLRADAGEADTCGLGLKIECSTADFEPILLELKAEAEEEEEKKRGGVE